MPCKSQELGLNNEQGPVSFLRNRNTSLCTRRNLCGCLWLVLRVSSPFWNPEIGLNSSKKCLGLRDFPHPATPKHVSTYVYIYIYDVFHAWATGAQDELLGQYPKLSQTAHITWHSKRKFKLDSIDLDLVSRCSLSSTKRLLWLFSSQQYSSGKLPSVWSCAWKCRKNMSHSGWIVKLSN